MRQTWISCIYQHKAFITTVRSFIDHTLYLVIIGCWFRGLCEVQNFQIMIRSNGNKVCTTKPRTLFWKCFLCPSNPKFPWGFPGYIPFSRAARLPALFLPYFNTKLGHLSGNQDLLWPERTELVGYWIPGKKQFAAGNTLPVLSNSEHASLKIATFSYDKISKYGTATAASVV